MKLNRTTLRTVEILRLISKTPEGATLDRLCEELKLPKTSAYDIVTTLVSEGMAQVMKGTKQSYAVGLEAYRIGISYANHLNYIGVMEPVLKAFSKEVGKTVFFGIPSGQDVVYLCKYEPENPIITTATAGARNPMYCTSLGKAILAYADEEAREAVLKKIRFIKFTERTVSGKAELLKELQLVRERGYALDEREMEEHMECAGAPVFDRDGKLIGAISVSGLYKPAEDYEALGALVAQKGREISEILGFFQNNPIS